MEMRDKVKEKGGKGAGWKFVPFGGGGRICPGRESSFLILCFSFDFLVSRFLSAVAFHLFLSPIPFRFRSFPFPSPRIHLTPHTPPISPNPPSAPTRHTIRQGIKLLAPAKSGAIGVQYTSWLCECMGWLLGCAPTDACRCCMVRGGVTAMGSWWASSSLSVIAIPRHRCRHSFADLAVAHKYTSKQRFSSRACGYHSCHHRPLAIFPFCPSLPGALKATAALDFHLECVTRLYFFVLFSFLFTEL
jgi:hypothetical protein